jgi:two-component system chemotaxis response regulator CheY
MQHILIVEDDPMMAGFEELSLRQIGGFTVTVSDNPDEVLDLVGSGNIDAVVMDVSLGKKGDGIKLTRQLKDDPKSKSVPILLATAHADDDRFHTLIEASGADDRISKPFRHIGELAEKVTKILANQPPMEKR